MAAKPPQARCLFKLLPGSKFLRPSEPQAQALEAIRATDKSGIVVLPCGAGKTAVFLQAALEAGNKVLFLNFEKQGVVQVADAIREHSNVKDAHLCVYSSEVKKDPNHLLCNMITTYSMFSSTSNRSSETCKVRKFVFGTAWDLVVLDECHHAWASTYRPIVEELLKTSKRVLGFTGTLCRSETVAAADASTSVRREAHAKEFAFIGEVLYSRTCAELEAAGLIAKVQRMQVAVALTDHFSVALAEASGSCKLYLQSINPQKLNATWMLVQMHTALGHVGMIFCDHLLPAKTLKSVLGARWEVLSGGNAHGTEGSHTAQVNADIVKRFNDGALDGLIATPVGESALDVHNTKFRYAIVIDAHGGQAPASQKLGRLSRTPRVLPNPDESAEDLAKRVKQQQKVASYYEIVTLNTEEETAAKARNVQFIDDGYECTHVDYGKLVAQLASVGLAEARAPYSDPVAQLTLLVECLSYQELGVVEGEGNARATEVLQPHRDLTRKLKQKRDSAKHPLFRQRKQQQLVRTRAQLPERKAEASVAKREVIDGAAMPEAAARVLRMLHLDAELLARAKLVLPPPPPPPPREKKAEGEEDDDAASVLSD